MVFSILDTIHSPHDLRQLPCNKLLQLSLELRTFILQTISQKGGHLASNLGTIELTIALHYVFQTPEDKLIWDVGHQSYGHKILTGRKELFDTIRQAGGLSGFTQRDESRYDVFGAGHASTSISAALGIAEGMRLLGQNNFSIAIIGDGSLTGGLAFEGLNNAGYIPAKNLIVVLNDNDMSIDPNVGALSVYINPKGSQQRQPITSGIKSSCQVFFECFGFKYYGPNNGHDIFTLVDIFKNIQQKGPQSGPFLVHVQTIKGKGYPEAEKKPLKYHGVTPFKIEDGLTPETSPLQPAELSSSHIELPKETKKQNYQDVFCETLIQLAHEFPHLIAITAAMPSGTGLSAFQKVFPDRFYDVGIAEAHAVVFASGLATQGLKPVCAIYSTFLQRAFDQIIHDVALQNLNVIFALDRSGPVGQDGATHQGAFDLTYIRAIPNFVLMAPKDEDELRHMLKTAVLYSNGPIALRYPRGEVVGVQKSIKLHAIPVGEGEFLIGDTNPSHIVILAVGYGVQTALSVVDKIQKETNYSVTLINARFIKPLDEELIVNTIRRADYRCLVVTIEENTLLGGFGSSILELFQEKNIHNPVLRFGFGDFFIEHASQAAQRKLAKIDPISIFTQISTFANEWFGPISKVNVSYQATPTNL